MSKTNRPPLSLSRLQKYMEGKVPCSAANVCTGVLPVLPGIRSWAGWTVATASCLPSLMLLVTDKLQCSVSCVHQLFRNAVHGTICCGEASTLMCAVIHGIPTAYAQWFPCSRHLHAHELQCSVSSMHQFFSNIFITACFVVRPAQQSASGVACSSITRPLLAPWS